MNKEQKHASELMPKSHSDIEILRARAEELAKEEVETLEHDEVTYVRFIIAQQELYGIAYQYVQEILRQVTIAQPPCVPTFIAGVINWRGNLITVIDLQAFLHGKRTMNHTGCIIVISAYELTIGLLIQRIEGSDAYQPQHLGVPLSAANSVNPDYILGLAQSLTAIINVETLVAGLNQETKKGVHRIGEVYGNCY